MRNLLIFLELARVIAGEAPGCSLGAKLAVAWVADNRVQQGVVNRWRDGWYGDRDPGSADIAVALLWQTFPDPTDGALYLIGPHDKAKMPWLKNMKRSARWKCAGTSLEAYKNSDVLRKSTGRPVNISPYQPHGDTAKLASYPVNF